jgi:hypothetical protein
MVEPAGPLLAVGMFTPMNSYNNQVTNYWNYLLDWIKTRFGT